MNARSPGAQDATNVAEAILAGGAAEAPAVLYGGETLTYAALRDTATRWGACLLASGASPGDRVGLFSENSPLWVAAYLGIIRAGLCAVPFQTDGGQRAFAQFVQSAAIRHIVVSPRFRRIVGPWAAPLGVRLFDQLPVASAKPAEPEKGDSPHLSDDHASIVPASGPFRQMGTVPFFRHLAAIMPTSGSTGDVKGVMVTHRNIECNTRDIIQYMGLTAADRVMVVLPLHYCYGTSLLHTHLMAGGCLVLNNRFMFPEKVLDEMLQQRCTGLAGVPSTYQILLRKTRFAQRTFPDLRWLQQAGGRLPNPFIRELRQAQHDVKLFIMYGQTEATARLSYLPPEQLEGRLGSIGRGLPGTRLEVLRPDGTAVPPGSDEVGEIVATGDNVTLGYWNDPAETGLHFRDGRLYTGDMARVDADGFIYIVERTRDFIKAMGHRISPKEVEEVIAELPEVVEVAVVGVAHELWGEAVKAFVVTALPGELTAERVRAHCLARLPNYKIPQYVEFPHSLPKTSNGKVAKELLREI